MNDIKSLSLLIIFLFLPGYTFIKLLFFSEIFHLEYEKLYYLVFSISISIVFMILIGFLLSILRSFNIINMFFSLTFLTIIFFIIGLYIGSYPSLKKMIKISEK